MEKISIIAGTRPEIIKLSPLIRMYNKKSLDVIFSGQHYDYQMGLQFFKELNLKQPDYHLKIARSNPANQIAQIIQKLSDIFKKTKPRAVVVQGDTNTVLAGAITGIKNSVPVIHVEAGIRSFDWRMPEEHNRITTDHISDLLFAPTTFSKKNLLNEKVHGKIFVTGNTVIDAIEYNMKLAEKKSKIDIQDDEFILLTLHRAENVDDKNILLNIFNALINSNEKILFPIHPRTKKRLLEFGLYNKIKNSNIVLIDPVRYFKMLLLMKKSKFIISDSGGIQEEATSPKIRKKVLVLRKTTDRPEAVHAGMAELVGISKNNILKSIKRNSLNPKFPKKLSPYGKGESSKKILKILKNHLD